MKIQTQDRWINILGGDKKLLKTCVTRFMNKQLCFATSFEDLAAKLRLQYIMSFNSGYSLLHIVKCSLLLHNRCQTESPPIFISTDKFLLFPLYFLCWILWSRSHHNSALLCFLDLVWVEPVALIPSHYGMQVSCYCCCSSYCFPIQNNTSKTFLFRVFISIVFRVPSLDLISVSCEINVGTRRISHVTPNTTLTNVISHKF